VKIFKLLQDLTGLSVEQLAEYEAELAAQLTRVTSDPVAAIEEYGISKDDLLAQCREAGEALQAARDALAADDEPVEVTDDEAAEFAALAEFADDAGAEGEGEGDEGAGEGDAADAGDAGEGDGGEGAAEEPAADAPADTAAVTAAARGRLPVAGRRRIVARVEEQPVALVATAGAPGMAPGEEYPDARALAQAMIDKRRSFGNIADGTEGEKVPIMRANWSDRYPSERRLSRDDVLNDDVIAEALDPRQIRHYFEQRRKEEPNALVASGGLCAPVTPYYQLAMVSGTDRPVRAALPSFNADRGGIRYARPATLASITTGVGTMTAANDALGGTFATKTCQVVDCPPFQETDVAILYHCLQFGNLGARTFPERVTQWNSLVMSAHARLAESALLTGIDTASTQVTAANAQGLGVSAELFSQIRAAAAGMRSRHRMATNAVLRLMLPWWAVYEIISDTYRGAFERWDVDAAKVISLLRDIDVEPTFYIDGAAGKGQVFGAQTAAGLVPFPTTINWFLFPEGSFLYLDGGTLELGLVRDSVLNKTNDFQIFGETFENVAFVGVESLSVVSTVSDCGVVVAAKTGITCPIAY
jgi:hypothetical protein